MLVRNSPVTPLRFDNRIIYIKRDDLLDEKFSGNKARKFQYLLDQDLSHYHCLISYGSAQSNALYSLSCLAKLKKIPLYFYCKHIAHQVVLQEKGNYAAAIKNGTNIIDVSKIKPHQDFSFEDYLNQTIEHNPNALFIPEGGHFKEAQYGLEQLGEEIIHWLQASEYSNLLVFLPSGTGTTALFLNQFFQKKKVHIRVITIACVGSSEYLKTQFKNLTSNEAYFPQVIELDQKHHFANLYLECFMMWNRLRQQGIEFDLIYDPIGWMALEKYLKEYHPQEGIMYLHQGGLLGNPTMLTRYKRKFPHLNL